MRRLIPFALLFAAAAAQAQKPVPVLLELFTSEGCSSCPPADSLLAELEKKQPFTNVDLIVLSEHVDYWNSLGWKDPYSSPAFSDRQRSYAEMMKSDDVYTPEAVVDGRFATVGSNRQNLIKAITASGQAPKPQLQITVTRQNDVLLVDVPAAEKGDLWIAIAQGRTVSHVANGENGGRTLQHVGVVRRLTKSPSGHARISIDKAWDSDLRVVAFVQDGRSGRIIQAAQKNI